MKTKFAAILFFLTLSCQGPWSYWPGNPENYQGIWTYAYVISGRPVEEVCFDKMHTLTEVRMPGFALYEDASVKITGTFSGKDTSFFLQPKFGKPNCFIGHSDLIAEAGKNYELDVAMVWDSAGEKVTSHFSAKTYIPQKFKIKRAYDLEGQQFEYGNVIYYLPPPMDLQSAYFIPEYSDDVGGVLVSILFPQNVDWGKSSIGEMAERFMEGGDSMFYAKFGDRYTAFFAENQAIAGMGKEIDSIPVLGMMMPAWNWFGLLFYATTSDYVKFRNTFENGSDDSRIEAVYNINGGAGIFAGMVVDTFEVRTQPSEGVETYNNEDVKDVYCRTYELDSDFGWASHTSRYLTRRECIEFWDDVIQCEIRNGKPKPGEICTGWHSGYWRNIPYEEMRTVLTYREFITWCSFRDFPIYEYPPCGSAMVRFYKMGAESQVLEREVKKWCQEHKNDLECESIL